MSAGTLSVVGGCVQAGYERVQDAFAANLDGLGQGGGAFAAYVDGELVVDLWGGQMAAGEPWRADTLGVIMSATKGLSALCAQILADEGRLDYEAPVASYWPEFAANGKDAVLVRHVLTHTAGVIGIGPPPLPVHWDGTGWDDSTAIAAALAAQSPQWRPGDRYGYHAVTYGWLVGELVKRITGQTLGQFFHERVARPLDLDVWIGTPESMQPRVAMVSNRLVETMPPLLRLAMRAGQRRLRDPGTLCGQAMLASDGTFLVEQFQNLVNLGVLAAELPFGGATATARSIARVYGMLAAGGELDGTRILSAQIVQRFGDVVSVLPDEMIRDVAPRPLRRFVSIPVRRTLGYLVNPKIPGGRPAFGPNPASYGHDGAGGQLGFCDPDARIGVGFVRSELSSNPDFSLTLLDALYSCEGAA